MAWLSRSVLPATILETLISLVLVACVTTANRYFDHPGPNPLVLGKTTRQEALAQYGSPTRSEILLSIDGKEMKSVNYIYIEPTQTCYVKIKGLHLTFHGDVLVMRLYHSGFPTDRTQFNRYLTGDIKEGEHTCNHVIDLMGAPHGEAIPPASLAASRRSLSYIEYTQAYMDEDKINLHARMFTVICDEDDVVLSKEERRFSL